jgi:HK97 family phage portal protein
MRAPAAPQADELRAGLVELFESWGGAKPREKIGDDFRSYTEQGYKGNSVIFAVVLARLSLFTEAEFCFQSLRDRSTYSNGALNLLQHPWENGNTGELLARMEQDVSLAGNFYGYLATPTSIQRLRPDWMEIITDGRVPVGYVYTPGGPRGDDRAGKLLLPEEVVHWSPIPDPTAAYRGMSWLTPCVAEVQSDSAMTRHKQMFFERAATPNLLIKYVDKLDKESRERLRAELNLRHEGVENAYRTMVLDGGADATVIGANMREIDFEVVQAAGENRIASAAGVPGIIAGLKEGLQAATYSNYAQAMRRFVDLWAFPQWRSACSALQKIVKTPGGSRLWFDTSAINALHESEADQADITMKKTVSIVNLVRAGYDGKAVAVAVETGKGIDSLPHTGNIYFPGAQAYTTPGGEAPLAPGDVPEAKDAVPAAPVSGATGGGTDNIQGK